MNYKLMPILERFPFWNQLNDAECQMVLENALFKDTIDEKQDIYELIPQRSIWMVYKGWVDISLQSSGGRQCRVVRMNQNESTYMILGRETERYPITVSMNKNTELCILPRHLTQAIFQTNEYVREFVIMAAEQQISRLVCNIGEIEFSSLKERLLHRLLEYQEQQKNDKIFITHEKLADELGSSREVISRLLKQMEKEGIVTLHRGKITISLKEHNSSGG